MSSAPGSESPVESEGIAAVVARLMPQLRADLARVKGWGSTSVEQVLVTSLTQHDAELRLSKYGANRLTHTRDRHWLKRLICQFNNVLIYLLLAEMYPECP